MTKRQTKRFKELLPMFIAKNLGAETEKVKIHQIQVNYEDNTFAFKVSVEGRERLYD